MLRFIQRPVQKTGISTALRTGLFVLPMFALAVWMSTSVPAIFPHTAAAADIVPKVQTQVIACKGIILSWTAPASAGKPCYYLVERAEGELFRNIACLKAEQDTKHYRFVDQSPAEGNNTYRITRTDFKGIHERSASCHVSFSYRKNELSQRQ